jgi:hypothetical protein
MKVALALIMMMSVITGCEGLSPFPPTSTPTLRPNESVLTDSTVPWWDCGDSADDCGQCIKSTRTLEEADIQPGTRFLRTGSVLSCYHESGMDGQPIGTELIEVEDPGAGQTGTVWVPMFALD